LDADPLNVQTERLELGGLRIAYAVFLLTAIGRVGELVPGLGSLPLAKITMGIGLILLIAKWKQLPKLPAVTTPFWRTALALVALAVVTAPFSVWRGMTFQFVILQLPVMAAAVIVCCKISYTWDALRGIMRVLVVAAVALGVAAILAFHGGRASAGVSYDPNDLAYVLVSTLPLALAFTLTAKTKAKILVNAGVCTMLLFALLLTSSRGGLFGLIAMLAVLVLIPLRRPPSGGYWLPQIRKSRNRIVLPVVGLVCASTLVWSYLPAETRERLSSVLQLSSDYNADTTNKDSRSAIWERGLTAALRRPMGYGLDTFQMVDVRMGGKFRAPHNSYLEVMVELGFLGLLLFIRMYVLSWRALQRVRKRLLALAPSEEHDQMLIFGRMLQVSLIGNTVSGFFLSMSYSVLLWVLFAAVSACVSLVVARSATATPVSSSGTGRADSLRSTPQIRTSPRVPIGRPRNAKKPIAGG
jgi:putative inorganic carbon (hco3(-)) transporter